MDLFSTDPLAPKDEFLEPDQADATCPVLQTKIFCFAFCPNHFHLWRRPVPLNEGRFAIVTDVGRGMRWTLWRL